MTQQNRNKECNLHRIPGHTFAGIQHWVECGQPCGGFLDAVICGDLYRAISRADGSNLPKLQDIVAHFFCCVPTGAYGSKQARDRWAAHRGMQGLRDERWREAEQMVAAESIARACRADKGGW